MGWQQTTAICGLVTILGGCASSLKMRIGAPLEVQRGHTFTETRFYQDGQRLDGNDVREKLAKRKESADSAASASTFDMLSLVRVPGFLLMIWGFAPASEMDLSTGTRVAMLRGAAACVGLGFGFAFAAESKYVAAAEQYNAHLSRAAGEASQPAEWSVRANKPVIGAQFPQSVSGYTFRMPIRDAERVCRGGVGDWSLIGSEGICRHVERPGAAASDVRLQFHLGALSGITIAYRSLPALLNRDYASLLNALRAQYGSPQDALPLEGECVTALAACLEEDQRVKAIVWSWARGSIELQPIWRGEHSQIELRYLSNDD
jgi:hypothetical protein